MYIEVSSGLASRCISVIQAYNIMRVRGGELCIIWPKTQDCNIRFKDVFDKSCFKGVDLKVIECDNTDELCLSAKEKEALHISFRKLVKSFHLIKAVAVYFRRRSALRNMDNKGRSKRFKKVLGYDGDRLQIYSTYPPQNIGWEGEEYVKYNKRIKALIEKALQKHSDIYISAYRGFLNDDKDMDYSILKFKNEYEEKVREILNGKENIIGMHIRRTDHDICIRYSTLDIFIDKMNEVIGKDEETFFFLATDDNEVERQLCELFPGRIIANSRKIWGRDSSGGMKSGIVDLLCLSSCRYIIGSYTSAFSSFAARYGGKRLEICRKEE